MSLSDLFPGDAIQVTFAYECARCGALVRGLATHRHYRWHQAVDTGATTALHSDSAPRSSGAGRPNPKDSQ